MVLESGNQYKRFKLNTILLINTEGKSLELMALCREVKIRHNINDIFAFASITFQSEQNIETIIEPDDIIRISYATGDLNDYNTPREFEFVIQNIPLVGHDKNVNSEAVRINLIDKRFYDMSILRFNKTFLKLTRTQILNQIFDKYNLNITSNINDSNLYDYYCLDNNSFKSIRNIRIMGNEPIFIYARNDADDILVKDMNAFRSLSTELYLEIGNTVGLTEIEMLNSVVGTFTNVYNTNSKIAGHISYAFDVDTKTPSYDIKELNDVFYPPERISNISVFNNCAYKLEYYYRSALECKYNLTSTSIDIGTIANVRVTVPTDNRQQSNKSGKYVVVAYTDIIDFGNMLLGQDLTLIKL